MAIQDLDDIISFIETELKTLTQLDTVVYLGADDPEPNVKKQGAVISVPDEDLLTTEHKYIGPHLTETWSINVDVILKVKSKTPRKRVSDAYGTSYWIRQLTALFLNNTNSGAFVRSQWVRGDIEEVNSGITIKGLVVIEILNKYT
tara:strand:+ start:473 stop:910 length:438 start_codon:yes stop_codon:yes gene_type:complete